MAKTRHAFILTVQTDDDAKASQVAKLVRSALSGLKEWKGDKGQRVRVSVFGKVTVSNVGESMACKGKGKGKGGRGK